MSWFDYGGMERLTCEVPCAGNPTLCPNGLECWEDVADGPSNVCRPRFDLRGCDDPGARVCGRPEKFADGLTRDGICGGCYGAIFCADLSRDGSLGLLQTLAPGIDCAISG